MQVTNNFESNSAIVLDVCLGSLIILVYVIAELLIIRLTSALTLCVVGVMKLVFIVVFSVITFSEKLSALNIAGIVIAVCGVILYNKNMIVGQHGSGDDIKHIKLGEIGSGLDLDSSMSDHFPGTAAEGAV